MNNLNNESGSSINASEQARQQRMYDQFEKAKEVYALHRLLAPAKMREKIMSLLSERLREFEVAGGNKDAWSLENPVLFCEDGNRVPYDVGLIRAEQYISQGIFR